MGNDIGYDEHNSCTVKGIPKTLEDAVFYSMELYNWIFKIQPRIIEDFFNDPVKTIKFSLKCGDLSNVLPIIVEHCEILSSTDDVLLKNISKWANRIYDKYINHDSELKQQWLTSIINLKFKALSRSDQRIKDLPNVLKLLDEYKHHLKGKDFIEYVNGMMRYKIKDLDFVEDEDSINFVYTTSNIRACKYKINQKDKLSILKIAKNIVPAISTTVSVATAMSLFELYKIALLTRMEHKVPLTSDELNNRSRVNYGDLNISLFNAEYKIWFVYNNMLECYNRNKLILILKPFNYFKTNGLSNLFNNNFFNLSVMKYYRNYPNPPQIFTVDNFNAWLHGISFSFWDYMIINDGITVNDYFKGYSSVTLGELAYVVGHLFDVKVHKLAFDTDLIEINNNNHSKPLRDIIKKDYAIIKLIATDNQTKEDIELPYIKYNK